MVVWAFPPTTLERDLDGWVARMGWEATADGHVFVCAQDATIRTRNITEKIAFDAVAGIMAQCK